MSSSFFANTVTPVMLRWSTTIIDHLFYRPYCSPSFVLLNYGLYYLQSVSLNSTPIGTPWSLSTIPISLLILFDTPSQWRILIFLDIWCSQIKTLRFFVLDGMVMSPNDLLILVPSYSPVARNSWISIFTDSKSWPTASKHAQNLCVS
jgi:hypothetical protein